MWASVFILTILATTQQDAPEAAAPATSAASALPESLDLETIRGFTVQHDGRWPPLDTVARDVVESVTGELFFQGRDPVVVLLGCTFDARRWMAQPMIPIGNPQLRQELELSPTQTVYSYMELVRHRPLRSLIDHLAHVEKGRKLDPLESKVSDINQKLVLLGDVFANRVIRPIPDPQSALGTWRPIPSPPEDDAAEANAVQVAWAATKEAFLADDAPAFASACERLAGALSSLPSARAPEPQRLATELRYNKLRPFRTAWMVMLVGAVLAAGAMVVRRWWFDGVALVGMVVGFGMLTFGLSLRWQIAGRIPAANMFESLLFLSWGMGAFAIVSIFLLRHRIVPLTASVMGALALILADCLPLDQFVRPIAPVLLDTVWMTIHVPVIMVSYSVLALAVVIAHVQLGVMAFVPRRSQLIGSVDSLHYWYVHVGALLLLVGIITGSMWAASSWGRYWGWDPKEVWSLVAFLGYLTSLHVRRDHQRPGRWASAVAILLAIGLFAVVAPKLAPLTGLKVLSLAGTVVAMLIFVLARGPLAMALKSILAFWLIIMTYVGVNFVLGIGLHSYAFGTGAVVRYMFLLGGSDLALIALLCAIYVLRRGWQPAPGIQSGGCPS